MKLRQKLAVVMATAMVVTAVPVVTSATTTNSMSMSSISMVKGTEVGFTTTEAALNTEYTAQTSPLTLDIEAEGTYNLAGTAGQTFFVKIDNATFSNAAYYAYKNGTTQVDKNGNVVGGSFNVNKDSATISALLNGTTTSNITVTRTSETELKVTVKENITKGDVISIPVLATAKSGDVKLTVDGTDTFVTSGTYAIGTTSEKQLSVAAPKVAKISEECDEAIGAIVITEAVKDAIANAADKKIEIKLPTSSDLEFVAGQKVKLVGGKGLAGEVVEAATTVVDGQTLTIDLGQMSFTNQTAVGQITISGIKVEPQGKTAAHGDVKVTVKNANMERTTLTVATIVGEDVSLTCAEPAAIIAGKEAKEVTFKLAENTQESIIDGRKAEFALENGFIAVRATSDSALQTIKDMVADGEIELPEQVAADDIVAAEANAEGQITGFTVQFNNLTAGKASELEFTMPIMADINTTGDVKLTVDGRAIQETKEVVIATVAAPFKVEAEAVELKVGLNGQVGGKLTITETAAEMLEKGEVVISIPEYAGITFKKGQSLNVTAENLKIKNVKVDTRAITFTVDRTSDEAGKVAIEGIEFNVDRTAPEGSFDLTIAGKAISTNEYIKSGVEKLTVADFVVIGTKNTEDITGSNGLKAGTASFSIGSTTYTVNGQEKTMDGTPYLQEGRTMMPIRYVSEAFGIEGDNILFSKGVVTIFAGNRIVQLTNGSNVALVNGVSYTMDQAVTIKEGRTYIPVGEVGRLLGVSVSWDNETKTATFKN